ncbi:ABC transporter permease [Actinomadura sp. 9N215]|uniref:ABC transporter permease n=1 Tax=Actinomadura sp. 9N215 TaxID=3375150 RepID=UPI0037A18ABF
MLERYRRSGVSRPPRHGLGRDVVAEAFEAIRGHAVRSSLTLAGVAFGILTLVATVGLTQSAATQVSSRFDALKATTVSVGGFPDVDKAPVDPATGLRTPVIASEALQRASTLNGFVAAGVTAITQDPLPPASRMDERVSSAAVETPVLAADPRALKALRVDILRGRLFDSAHEEQHHRVVVLGDIAARNLGFNVKDPDVVDGRTNVFIAGRPYLLIGVMTSPNFESQAPLAAIVPEWVSRDPTARMSFGDPRVVIQTRLGAAQKVGIESKVALSPEEPELLVAQVPPDPRSLRAGVEADTRALFIMMAAVSLLIGTIGIGNTTLISALDRRHEIGLRRAVGASRRSILSQFLMESGILGLLGGLAGTIVGLDISIAVALLKGWVAAVPPWIISVGPPLGLAVGLAAGVYPAAKAARMEPVAALAT